MHKKKTSTVSFMFSVLVMLVTAATGVLLLLQFVSSHSIVGALKSTTQMPRTINRRSEYWLLGSEQLKTQSASQQAKQPQLQQQGGTQPAGQHQSHVLASVKASATLELKPAGRWGHMHEDALLDQSGQSNMVELQHSEASEQAPGLEQQQQPQQQQRLETVAQTSAQPPPQAQTEQQRQQQQQERQQQMQSTQQKVYRCLKEAVPTDGQREAATYHAHKSRGDVARCGNSA
jgi:hypothetical protein